MDRTSIEQALNWRYATKRFDSTRKIAAADWETLQSALVKAPSSYGLQPWRFLVIENPALRAKLREVSWGQSAITDADKLVVFVTRESVTSEDVERYLGRIAEVRGVTSESLAGFRSMLTTNLVEGLQDKALNWTQRQAYIAMGFLLETAALLKVDSVPLEGLDPAAYDRILELEGTGWRAVAAVALGYRHAEDAYQNIPKVRYPVSEVIHYR